VPDNNDTQIEGSTQTKNPLSLLQVAGWFFAALILISIGGGYFLWQFVNDTKDSIDQNIANNKSSITSLSDAVINSELQLNNQIKQLTLLQNDLSNSVEAFLAQSSHLRKDWLVGEAEYLVKLAANRLTLETDIKTAITALSSADARLLEAGDPGLLLLRQEISNNIVKLQALPVIDVNGISIKISSIIQQIDYLPLVTPEPDNIKQKLELEQTDSDTNNTNSKPAINWKSVTTKVVSDLLSLVRVRKHDQVIQPLLTPEQRFFLTQNLKLQLEQARTALLHQQQRTFRERLTKSIEWIKEYFDQSKSATQSAITILTDLNKVNLTQRTPDLSYALQLFTKFQAGIRLHKKTVSVTKKKSTKTVKKTLKKNNKKKKPIKKIPVKKQNTKVEIKKVSNTKPKVAAPIKKPLEKNNSVTKKTTVKPVEVQKEKSNDQKNIQNNNDNVTPITPGNSGVSL